MTLDGSWIDQNDIKQLSEIYMYSSQKWHLVTLGAPQVTRRLATMTTTSIRNVQRMLTNDQHMAEQRTNTFPTYQFSARICTKIMIIPKVKPAKLWIPARFPNWFSIRFRIRWTCVVIKLREEILHNSERREAVFQKAAQGAQPESPIYFEHEIWCREQFQNSRTCLAGTMVLEQIIEKSKSEANGSERNLWMLKPIPNSFPKALSILT